MIHALSSRFLNWHDLDIESQMAVIWDFAYMYCAEDFPSINDCAAAYAERIGYKNIVPYAETQLARIKQQASHEG